MPEDREDVVAAGAKNANAPSTSAATSARRGGRQQQDSDRKARRRAHRLHLQPLGTRNGRGRSGSLMRSTMMPAHTRMNANSVPMFVRSTISSMLATAAKPPTKTPVRIVDDVRRTEARMDRPKSGGSKPVPRHREEDARLSQLEHQQHRRVRDDRSERDDPDCPAQVRSWPCCRAIVSGSACSVATALRFSVRIRDQSGEHRRDHDVEDRADDQRGDDADRQVALRVARLLGDR